MATATAVDPTGRRRAMGAPRPPIPPPARRPVGWLLAFAHPPTAATGPLGWSAAVAGVAVRRAPPCRPRSGGGRGAARRAAVASPIVAATPPAARGGGGGGVGAGVVPPAPRPRDAATLTLVVLNAAVFGVWRARLAPRLIAALFLDHSHPRWWQLLTSTVCHFSAGHLSSNLFFLLLFGRLVEEEAGAAGLALVYIVCGVSANALSLVLLPAATLSAGASGSVFGLFVVALLLRSRWGVRGLVDAAVLGQFVVRRVYDEAQAALAASREGWAGRGGVNHVAHLGGALAGVLLLWAVRTFVLAMERKARGSGGEGGKVPPVRR